MRNGATDEELLAFISNIWHKRTDRYSEERLAALNSPTGYNPKEHRKLEMISLGG
jgi:cyclic pyranopterin phosphate synthase